MGRDYFNALFKTYVENNWQGMDCYNAFIKGFGSSFDSFNTDKLCGFVAIMQQAGLNQKDIVSTVADRIKEISLE